MAEHVGLTLTQPEATLLRSLEYAWFAYLYARNRLEARQHGSDCFRARLLRALNHLIGLSLCFSAVRFFWTTWRRMLPS